MNGQKVVCLLCLLLLLLLSTGASAKIVFGSERDGVQGIYVMDDDGSNQTLILESALLRPFPTAWSPDGKQIAFNRSGNLYLMNPDGTNVRNLIKSDDGGSINSGRFSPDGKYTVFKKSFRKNGELKYGIYTLNIKTGKLEKISDLGGIQCDWSPDGKHIIFAEPIAVLGGGGTIWIINARGHNPRPLIPAPGVQAGNFVIHRSKPRWSPNGQKIVFIEREYKWERWPGLGNALIHKEHRYMICDHTSDNIKQLQIPKDWECYGIDWMDNGESVVFTARQGMPLNEPIPRNFEFPPCYLYKYHIKTEKRTQLTNDPGWDQTIDWISDDILSVTPQGKKKVTWGTLKQ